jgi:small subunit ribosomal protein S17
MKVRGKRKISIGRVVSDRMDKTIVVEVERRMSHPIYRRTIRRKNKFKVHDASQIAKVGDLVKIMETRPLSKDKNWRLVDILEKSK